VYVGKFRVDERSQSAIINTTEITITCTWENLRAPQNPYEVGTVWVLTQRSIHIA
jgi:hypothetical protein